MKRVFKLFVLLFIMTILCGCSKDENELIMVTEAGFAPYEYYDSGEIVGVDVDIANEIAKEIGKRVYSSTNDIYKTNYKYVESYYYDSTNKMYIASYYTVVNRLGYTFTAQKSENFTDTEKNQIRDTIKSVSYDIKPKYKEEEKTSFNFNNILIYAAIGGVAGGLASYIASKKKKNQDN